MLVVHDTTTFWFGGEKQRPGLGWLSQERKQGFLAHFSICLSSAGRPLGSLAVQAWARHGEKKGRRRERIVCRYGPDRESLRWQEAILLTDEMLCGSTEAVHVMDREGDQIELLSLLLEHDLNFVVRLAHDRRLETGRGASNKPKLFASLSRCRYLFEREVQVGSRGPRKQGDRTKGLVIPSRPSRKARLAVRAVKREIFSSHDVAAHVPASLRVNVVEVREVAPPRGEEPVVWRLVTNRPIDTREEVAAVIDAYRQRWQIEEFFKAIKTGCRYQQLQLANQRALLIALSITIAVSWRLLLLRWAVHHQPNAPAKAVLSEDLQPVVSMLARVGKRQKLTVRAALFAIAGLAGHLKNNGPPGWLLLARGYATLLAIERGWRLATCPRAYNRRCDQS